MSSRTLSPNTSTLERPQYLRGLTGQIATDPADDAAVAHPQELTGSDSSTRWQTSPQGEDGLFFSWAGHEHL